MLATTGAHVLDAASERWATFHILLATYCRKNLATRCRTGTTEAGDPWHDRDSTELEKTVKKEVLKTVGSGYNEHATSNKQAKNTQTESHVADNVHRLKVSCQVVATSEMA